MNRKTNRGFLNELADHLIGNFADSLDQLTVVFPNRRAGLFFTRALAGKIQKPIWSPVVLSLEDFISQFSGIQLADRISLLLDLYETYIKIIPVEETFDNFFFWGEMLLKDFDEVDKYLADAERLFITLKNLKEIDSRFQFLPDEQKKALESFWSATLGNPSKDKKNFMVFWQALAPIYTAFNQRLKRKQYGYQGMIYKDVLEKTRTRKINTDDRQILFAGFNALTRVEEELIKWFIREKNARIYWDLDAYYFEDPAHEAGVFLRKYYRDPVFRPFFPKTTVKHFPGKQIRTISASQYPAQVKIAGRIIHDLQDQDDISALERTVIVLPDETLLSSLLYALPDDVRKLNITMGYPVTSSSFYSLMDHLIDLQENARRGSENTWFNHNQVVRILNHPLVVRMVPEESKRLLTKINRFNIIHVPAGMLTITDSLQQLFKVVKEPAGMFDYLMDILIHIRRRTVSEEMEGFMLEREFALVIYRFFNRLKETFSQRDIKLTFPLVGRVIRSYARNEKIPFTGEPLEGLQIMGLLETRNLDFDHVILLNVNEGFFPGTSGQSSFIPHNVRRAFQLPTRDSQDAIYAYLFYRLIQRAGNVHLIYNSEDAYNRNSEPSRYIYQLEFESGLKINHLSLVNDISIKSRPPVKILKDEFVRDRLNRYLTTYKGEKKHLTPSKLNMYLNCPLSFCYRYVYDVEEKEEVTEDLDAAKFGLILHKTMEYLYKPFEGVILTDKIFKKIFKGIEKAIHYGFANYHGVDEKKQDFRFEGKNLLGREIIIKYMKKILEHDQKQIPFRIKGVEINYDLSYPLILNNRDVQICLRGIIDRIDILEDGSIRIIDYKSGRDLSSFKSIESLFDRSDTARNKAVFQIFLYALLYLENHPGENGKVFPGLYNFKELHSDHFDVRIKKKIRSRKSLEPINDIRPWIEDFRPRLDDLLREIFNPSVPFEHVENKKECIYCVNLGAPSEFN
jgi:hypothetical protein